MRSPLLTAAVLSALAVSSPAPAQPAPGRSSRPAQQDACFNATFVNNFTAPDEETVYIRVGVKDVYRLKLFAPCLNVDWRNSIALRTRSGSDWICRGFDAELIVPMQGMGPQRCPVTEIRKLTPEEVAALPRKARP